MNRNLVAAAACVLALTGSALAQDNGTDHGGATKLPRLVVSPNRAPTEQSKIGSKVEQVTQDEIEQKSLPLVSDYLKFLPGVATSATGGAGAESGIAIRGLPRRYIKTLYNGIDISDPTATQVQTSYQYLLSGGVDNIEVLKGSQGTLYGSDAIAGVVSISTLGGLDTGVHHTLETEGGSFGTVRGRYGLKAADDTSRLALNVTGFRTDGISSADSRAGNTERDGFEEAMFDINGEHRFSDAFSVFGSAIYIKGKAEYDDDFPTIQDNPYNHNLTRQLAGRFGFNLDLMDGRLKNTVSVQGFQLDRGIRSVSVFGPFDADYHGTRTKVDYQGSFEATDRVLFQYGVDHEQQNAQVTDNFGTNSDDRYSLTGLWAQAIVEPIDDLVLSTSVRHDEHSEFGGYTTYRGSASYLLGATGTRFHSSLGTGFRAPSLYELYGPFVGNVELQPETSVSFDIGAEQSFFDGRLTTNLTYFMLNVDDLIVYDNTSYIQVPGTSHSRGIEASLSYAMTDWLDVGGSYTLTNSIDQDGRRIARVPRNTFVLSAVARPAEKWTVSGDVKIVSNVVDAVKNVEVPLDDYVLVNAKAAYQLTDSTQVYLRGENLLNAQYQTVAGFGTPGISVFAGVKAQF